MPNQTPEQREAALKLANTLYRVTDSHPGVSFAGTNHEVNIISLALLDLHAENVRLREALKRIGKRTCVGNCDQDNTCSVCIARAALSGSPATED